MKPAIQFHTDAIFIDRLTCPLIKNAQSGLLSSLISAVQSHIESKVEEHNGDKMAALTDFLVPGLFWVLELRWLAILVEISKSYFGLSPGRILETAWAAIKPQAQSGSITSSQIDEAVQSAIGGGGEKTSSRAYRLMALGISTQITVFAAARSTNSSLMGKIVSWILKAALAAAGIEVAGMIFNKLTGHEDAKPTASGLPTLHPSQEHFQSSTQTVLKPSPSYTPEHYNQNSIWMEAVPPSNIGEVITRWATTIYPDLQGHEDLITSSPNFQSLVATIQEHNSSNASQYTFIPEAFSAKKQLVDIFIDQTAAKYQALQSAKPAPPPTQKPNKAA